MSMKMFYPTKLLSTLLLIVVLGISCNKDDDSDNSVENTGYAEDQATIEQAFDDLDVMTLKALYFAQTNTSGGFNPLSSCATVSIDTTGSLNVMTIDFGQKNCLSFDGRYRRGRLIVNYSGKYSDSTHYRRVEPDNYYVDDNRIDGTKSVSTKGRNSFGYLEYNVSFEGTVSLADITKGKISAKQTRLYRWVGGETTPQVVDDVFQVEGQGSLTRSNGETFTVEVLDPILLSLDCNWITQGIVRIVPENARRRSLDYGDGTCDNKAELTVNGVTRQVILAL